MRKFFLTIVLLGLGLLTVVSWQTFSFLYSHTGSADEKLVFEVPPGQGMSQVAQRLEKEQVITDAMKMKILARLAGYSTKVRVGEYELNKGMNPLEVLKVISSGRSVGYPITVVEGANIYEIADELEKMEFISSQEFLRLVRDPELIRELLGEDLPSLEGYLFPETYLVTKYTEPETLVRLMVERFKKVYSEVESQAVVKMPRHKVVTLASVIEKETGAPEERPLIASVFHNRLKKSMRLQSDPTILYGILDKTGVMPKNIKKRDIRAHTKYNTYTVRGLPFGPIANPGREALLATVKPETSPYLFFVSRNDGTHVFSETYKQHNQAVRRFQLNRKAREGKSWRDLNKRREGQANAK